MVRCARVAGVREVGAGRDLVVGDPLVPDLQRHVHLHPREVRAEAAVEAAGEADVGITSDADANPFGLDLTRFEFWRAYAGLIVKF